MSGDNWRFNTISRDSLRGGGPVLSVSSPSGLIRKIPLDVKDLARIMEEAARQLRVELGEWR